MTDKTEQSEIELQGLRDALGVMKGASASYLRELEEKNALISEVLTARGVHDKHLNDEDILRVLLSTPGKPVLNVLTEPLTYDEADAAADGDTIMVHVKVGLHFFIGNPLDAVLDGLNELAVQGWVLGNISYSPVEVAQDGDLIILVVGDLMRDIY